ncbi:MAG: hypothetical protein H6R25_834 [Proteobacteria bacterium]|nr:hypothetical protein [Pseudomonadota bacterium]
MRIEKVIGWFIRQIPDSFFDALSGNECAEMDGIVHNRMLNDTEQNTVCSVAGRDSRQRDK